MFQIPRFIAHKSNTMCNKQPFSTHSKSLLTVSPSHPSTLRIEYPFRAQTYAPQPTLRTEYPFRAQTSTPQPTLRTEYPIHAQTSLLLHPQPPPAPPAPATPAQPAPSTPAAPAAPAATSRSPRHKATKKGLPQVTTP